jgi:integrase/recombinase XerD
MTDALLLAPHLQIFFIQHLQSNKRASGQTIAAYRDTFRLLLQFMQQTHGTEPSKLRLPDLDANTLLSFLDHLERKRNNSVRSRNARLAAIRCFFRFVALRKPECVALVTQVLAIPVKRNDRRIISYLTKEEINGILAAPDQSVWLGRRDYALLLTLYNTGARVSELITLQQSQLHMGVHTFLQLYGKGRKERVVPLWPKTAQVLRSWFREIGEQPNRLVFPNAHKGSLTRQGVNYILSQTAHKAQSTCPSLKTKRVSPHLFRHTTAMHLLQGGVDTETITLWLGHENIQTTHVYVEADLAAKEKALNKLAPAGTSPLRFKADDALMAFLNSL